MARRRFTLVGSAALLLWLCICAGPLAANDTKTQNSPASASPSIVSPDAPKLTSRTRLEIIRSLQSERVFAKVLFPQGKSGLKIKDGVVTPSQQGIAQMIAENGPAAKPGDRCVITNVEVREKEIIFEINGGPRKGPKWYQRIELGTAGSTSSIPASGAPQSLDAHGSVVKLQFDKYVPEMTGDQVRAMLAPVFDFHALTTEEAYEKTLPPKVRDAIKNHQVLVGMNKDMVEYAKGRPPHKIREKDDQGREYEEWIYGTPPEEVDFVRFEGGQVARLEIMTVDGKKIVRTEKEVDLKPSESEVADNKPKSKPENAPTLLRPGEKPDYGSPIPADQRDPSPQDRRAPPDGTPYPDGTGMPGSGPQPMPVPPPPGPGGQVPPPQ
jgi:hypothetical protein